MMGLENIPRKFSELGRWLLINQLSILHNQREIMKKLGIDDNFQSEFQTNDGEFNHLRVVETLREGIYDIHRERGGLGHLSPEIPLEITANVISTIWLHNTLRNEIERLEISEEKKSELHDRCRFLGYDNKGGDEDYHRVLSTILDDKAYVRDFPVLREVEAGSVVGPKFLEYDRMEEAFNKVNMHIPLQKEHIEFILQAKNKTD